jgi:hypothetical protein
VRPRVHCHPSAEDATLQRLSAILVLAAVVAGCGAPTRSLWSAPEGTSAAAIESTSPSLAGSSARSSPQAGFTPSPGTRARTPTIGPRPEFAPGALLVTVSDNVRVRSKPRVSADSVKYEPVLATGTDLTVLAGPVEGSGYWWYSVRLEDGLTLRGGITSGWVPAADHDGEPWIQRSDAETDPVPEPDYPDFPVPVLAAGGIEDYLGSDGTPYTRYDLSVVNWTDYPAELFAAQPDLEPCGLNSSASRTWVDIVDADHEQRIYGFCALGEPQGLTGIWFALGRGVPPPRVYVVLWDRLYDRLTESNPVSPPSSRGVSPAPGG